MQLTRVFFALWLLGWVVPCWCAADENADELAKLAGRYERSATNNAGTVFRLVKEIDGNQELVTTYDDAGNVVMAHTATIKVEKRGPVRVFSFFNRVFLAGPLKGGKHFETVSYVYRTDDESFVEARGIMEGDPSPPGMLIWRRVKAEK